MDNILVLVLLVVNSLLVFAMLMVLLGVLRQGRRIARIAKQTQELSERAEEESKEDLVAELPEEERH